MVNLAAEVLQLKGEYSIPNSKSQYPRLRMSSIVNATILHCNLCELQVTHLPRCAMDGHYHFQIEPPS